uniref:Uncharacterized protein n=1 Tax=Oryza brachyantha TaxID=4533 RepID=J3N8Q1_ORYBR
MSDGGDPMTINDDLRLLGEWADDEDDVDCELAPFSSFILFAISQKRIVLKAQKPPAQIIYVNCSLQKQDQIPSNGNH